MADANVLLRAMQGDDARQAEAAATALLQADSIAVATPALCEFVWVLDRGYRLARSEIAQAIRELTGDPKVKYCATGSPSKPGSRRWTPVEISLTA